MAIILDESARGAVARRRARGKDATLFLRLERSSMRAGVPWVVAVGWAPHRRAEDGFVLQHAGDAQIRLDPRIARYTQWHNLTISGARLGPWSWPVVADPFAFEHMREWELVRWNTSLPSPRRATVAETVPVRDRAEAAEGMTAASAPSGKATGSDTTGTNSGATVVHIGSVADWKEAGW